MLVIDQVKEELKKLNGDLPLVNDWCTHNHTLRRINELEKQLASMQSISNVVNRRRQRGANAISIEAYKYHLSNTAWRNNELMKRCIAEIV